MPPLYYSAGVSKKRGAVVPVTVNPVLVTRCPVPVLFTLYLLLLPCICYRFYVPITIHPVTVTRYNGPVIVDSIPVPRYPVLVAVYQVHCVPDTLFSPCTWYLPAYCVPCTCCQLPYLCYLVPYTLYLVPVSLTLCL